MKFFFQKWVLVIWIWYMDGMLRCTQRDQRIVEIITYVSRPSITYVYVRYMDISTTDRFFSYG